MVKVRKTWGERRQKEMKGRMNGNKKMERKRTEEAKKWAAQWLRRQRYLLPRLIT